jgi:hypothetical protein
LRPADYVGWIDRAQDDAEEVLPLVYAFEGAMVAAPVNTYVNDAHHDGPNFLAAPT